MKICTIVGARPQFIKLAIVSRAMRSHSLIEEIIVHTGQHYDSNMSDVFFEELEIPKPDICLEIGSASHGAQTGRMLEEVEKVLVSQKPDFALVYGDTNSTLAGVLAAVKLHIPVAHVEAGLRSFNRRMPEEINRVLTDHACNLLFTPTDTASKNLKQEGIENCRIKQVGDVMYDTALFFGSKAEQQSDVLRLLALESGNYVLATIHRAENTDEAGRLRNILNGLSLVSGKMEVVLPLHPRTRAALANQGLDLSSSGVRLIEPVGYLDMVMLERHAALVATDSGGVQKEAYFHRRPCVTLREETEWVELVKLGWNTIASTGNPQIIAETILGRIGSIGQEATPYGKGDSAQRIVNELMAFKK